MKSSHFEIVQENNIERDKANWQGKGKWMLFVLFFRLLYRFEIFPNKVENV